MSEPMSEPLSEPERAPCANRYGETTDDNDNVLAGCKRLSDELGCHVLMEDSLCKACDAGGKNGSVQAKVAKHVALNIAGDFKGGEVYRIQFGKTRAEAIVQARKYGWTDEQIGHAMAQGLDVARRLGGEMDFQVVTAEELAEAARATKLYGIT